MTCKLARPSAQDLFDTIKNRFSADVLGGFEIIPESNEWYVVAHDYAMQEEFYSIAEQQWKARDPRYACCEDLYAMAALDGVLPRDAGFAQGYVRVSGDVGTSIPSTIEIMISGQRYRGIGSIPAVVPGVGYVDFRVRAVVPGASGNISTTGQTGTLTTPVAGLNSSVTLHGSFFCGGTDKEDCEVFRQRYIERLGYRPRGTQAWIIDKIMEWPCVTRVAYRGGNCCTYPQEQGPDCGCSTCTNKNEFYPLFDTTFDCGIPPQCVVDDMNNWLFGSPAGRGLGEVEIGVCGQLFRPSPGVINVRISGMSCASAAQVAEVKSRIGEIFSHAAPSELFTARAIEIVIAQVLGQIGDVTVSLEIVSGDMAYTSCGDVNPACDVLPCLGDIVIVNTFVNANIC